MYFEYTTSITIIDWFFQGLKTTLFKASYSTFKLKQPHFHTVFVAYNSGSDREQKSVKIRNTEKKQSNDNDPSKNLSSPTKRGRSSKQKESRGNLSNLELVS